VLRRILLSRFFVVPATITVIVLVWNVYVSMHDHGVVVGHVVDASGHPVAGATVVLYNHDFITQVEHARTKTDAGGAFRFDHNESHLIMLQAVDGAAQSPRRTVRLWFRSQDRVLDRPLRLGAS
jgi:hypothetical protein